MHTQQITCKAIFNNEPLFTGEHWTPSGCFCYNTVNSICSLINYRIYVWKWTKNQHGRKQIFKGITEASLMLSTFCTSSVEYSFMRNMPHVLNPSCASLHYLDTNLSLKIYFLKLQRHVCDTGCSVVYSVTTQFHTQKLCCPLQPQPTRCVFHFSDNFIHVFHCNLIP